MAADGLEALALKVLEALEVVDESLELLEPVAECDSLLWSFSDEMGFSACSRCSEVSAETAWRMAGSTERVWTDVMIRGSFVSRQAG